jgi:regulator of sigma E protease
VNLVTILAVAVVFGLLVTVHEAGHFVVAKLNGVKVLSFNVGFGSPLVQRRRGETLYAVRAIPLGGYVRLAGMDDGETGPRSFNSKPVWRRISIIAAGSITNLLLPLVIFFFAAVGTAGPGVVVQTTIPDKPAAAAGIRAGDQILAVNGSETPDVAHFRTAIPAAEGAAGPSASARPIEIKLRHRDGATQSLTVTPVLDTTKTRWVIGVVPGGTFSLVGGAVESVNLYRSEMSAIGTGLYQLVAGHIPGGVIGPCGVSGPVGIVRETAEVASAGWIQLALFAAFLSINLGILNLLPLPALDGGRLAFLLVEAIRRRPIDPAKEQRVHYIGLVVLLTLIVLITYNDISRLSTPLSDLVQTCRG